MRNKKIILVVTGGIAVYKSCQLLRLLKKSGYDVVVVMSEAAKQFVTPQTFQALSSHPVISEVNYDANAGGMAHIDLTRDADLILLAPATANTLAKIAHGIADNLVTDLIAARKIPLIVVPAMNVAMWANPPNQRNIQLLKQDKITVLGPEYGEQACGEVGLGRMLEPEVIVDLLSAAFTEKYLLGKKVLITTGATREMIDPVRCITNLSSGKMGIEIARACRNAGALVTLIYGEIAVDLPNGLNKMVYVNSCCDMYQKVHENVTDADVFIAVAAVSDYRVKNHSAQKIKKVPYAAIPVIELAENPDILASVTALDEKPFCVGFAAESEHLIKFAAQKRIKKNLPLIIANLVDNIGKETNSVYLIGNKGTTHIKEQPKNKVAQEIVKTIAEYLN